MSYSVRRNTAPDPVSRVLSTYQSINHRRNFSLLQLQISHSLSYNIDLELALHVKHKFESLWNLLQNNSCYSNKQQVRLSVGTQYAKSKSMLKLKIFTVLKNIQDCNQVL